MHTEILGIQPGWDVRDVDGSAIGTVQAVGDGFIRLKTRGLFSRDYFVPHSAIDTVEEHWVEVHVRKNELADLGWDQPPDELGAG
jgi:hypothetical protein